MNYLLLSLLSLTALAQADEKKAEVPLKNFNDSKVLIGKLGVPFGTIVRVTCRSIEPNEEEANRKGDPWKRQVEITSIQGKAVEPVIRIEWANFEADSVPKPPAGEISEVWAYEAGSFQGLPDDLLKYLGEHLPQGRGFAFVNRLVAIRKVGPEDQK